MSSTQSLIFIPDISGFTTFVHQTAAEHSEHIISELLELLIDQNAIDLQLAEIEGDALFFYRYQSLPDLDALIAQVRKMYDAFHKHLKYYESHRICQCGACSTAHKLTLKFVAHSGDFRFITVKDIRKPFGEEVIAAHRLLKNKVPSDEYLLISETMMRALNPEGLPGQHAFQSLSDTYDFGSISYSYMDLSAWKEKIHDMPLETKQELANKIFETHFEVDSPADDVYELLTNFKYRAQWNAGVDKIDFEEGRVNRVGSEHVCVIRDKTIAFKTITRQFGKEFRVYGERTEEPPGFQYVDFYYLVEDRGDRTAVQVKIYGKAQGLKGMLLKPFMRRVFRRSTLENIRLLKDLALAFRADGRS